MTATLHVLSDHDPETFRAETAEQLVGLLWKTGFLRETGPGEYMVEVARRVAIYNRCVVRSDTARHFLDDLVAAGLVTIDWGQ